MSELLSHYVLEVDLLKKLQSNRNKTAKKYCLLISPVSQSFHQHQLAVTWADLELTQQEAQKYCDELNTLYAEEGYHFQAPMPDCWLMETPKLFTFQATCPYDLPPMVEDQIRLTGPQAAMLRLHQAEIQMHFQSVPLNKQREDLGKLPINGVWFWQGLPSMLFYPEYPLILLSDTWNWLRPEAAIVDKQQGIEQAKSLLQLGNSVVLFFDKLEKSNRMGDFDTYLNHLEWMGRQVEEFFRMQQRKEITCIELVSNGPAGGRIQLKQKTWFQRKQKKNYLGRWIE
ncbi:MAG: hypothetical protein WDW21_05180 [Neisseriaceae bacterium]